MKTIKKDDALNIFKRNKVTLKQNKKNQIEFLDANNLFRKKLMRKMFILRLKLSSPSIFKDR